MAHARTLVRSGLFALAFVLVLLALPGRADAYPATSNPATYTCPSGGTLSGTTCTTTSSYAATFQPGWYSCPSGGTVSGSSCVSTSTYAATWNPGYYYCPSGGSLSGSTCFTSSSYGASYTSGYYTCPSGGSLSGSTCSTTTTYSGAYGCGPRGAYWYAGRCYEARGAAIGTCNAGWTYNGAGTCVRSGYANQSPTGWYCGGGYPAGPDGAHYCYALGSDNWTCNAGDTGGGYYDPTCYHTTSYAASYTPGYYSCPSGGSLSGSTCTISSSYGASYQNGWYTCPSGGSLSGSTCTVTSSYAATWNPGYYTCPSGGTLSGSTCTTTSTYAASVATAAYYSCPSGGTLSGSRCLPGASIVADGTGADVAWDASAPLDANWSTPSGAAIASWQWCFTTVSGSCASGVVASGTGAARTSSSGAVALVDGTRYHACVQATDTSGDLGPWSCSDGVVVDTTAPPVVAGLAAPPVTTSPPALSWPTVIDPTSGVAYYRVYRGASATGPWTLASSDGAVTAGTWTDLAAPFGTSYYMVQAVDVAGNQAAASNVVATLLHRAPNVPSPGAPADVASSVSTFPDLTAGYLDADGDSGTVEFDLCDSASCTTVVQSATPAVASGGTATWSVPTALARGTTYWWRVRATDVNGAASAWSATRSFTTTTQASMTVAMSTLGYHSSRRTLAPPYDIDFGGLAGGVGSVIGDAASGQALPGSAMQVQLSSDAIADLQVSASAPTSGQGAMPVASLGWRPHATPAAWTAFTGSAATVASSLPVGTNTIELDLRLDVPAAQRAGAYAASITVSAVAVP
jgi:hypothetical protein